MAVPRLLWGFDGCAGLSKDAWGRLRVPAQRVEAMRWG